MTIEERIPRVTSGGRQGVPSTADSAGTAERGPAPAGDPGSDPEAETLDSIRREP
jgi:hypothetical protein